MNILPRHGGTFIALTVCDSIQSTIGNHAGALIMGMKRKGKIWIIEEDEATDDSQGSDGKKHSILLETAPLIRPIHVSERERKKSKKVHPLRRILFAYLLGPFATGLRHPLWTPLSALSLVLLAAFLATGMFDGSDLARGRPLALIIHAVAAASVLSLASAWSVALLRAGREFGLACKGLADPLFRPGTAAFIGLWLPGFSLLLANEPRRAALAWWNLGPLTCALFLLFYLWRAQGRMLWIGYEYLLLASMLIAVLAVMTSLAWALEGLRMQRRRARQRSGLRGDRLALLLLASLGLFFFVYQPVTTAEDLHRQAGALAEQGFRLLPLTLERIALHIDRSCPEYWLAAANYYEALGRDIEATRLRSALWLQWRELQNSIGAEPYSSPAVSVQPPTPFSSPPAPQSI